MNKKQLFAEIILILVITFLTFSVVKADFVSGSKIKIDTNIPGFNGPNGVWVINFIDSGFTTDRIRALFDKNTLSNSVDGNAKQDFMIDVDGTESSCKWDIKSDPRLLPIYTVDIVKGSFWAWEIDTVKEIKSTNFYLSNCLEMDDYPEGVPLYTSGLLKANMWCYKVKDTLAETVGKPSNQKITTKTKWVVTTTGKKSYTAEIGNDDAKDGKTSNIGADVKIRWNGQLSNGEKCPDAERELLAYKYKAFPGNWRIINANVYSTQYEAYMRTNLDDLIMSVGKGMVNENSAESTINNKAYQAIVENKIYKNSPIIQDTSMLSGVNNGVLKFELARIIAIPQFTLFVDSDYLELVIPTGEPSLSKTSQGLCLPDSNVRFKEGDLKGGQFTVKAENVGDGDGGFN